MSAAKPASSLFSARASIGWLLVLCVGLIGCNPRNRTEAAEAAVAEFHRMYDAKDFEAIYDNAHADFKAQQPKADMLEFIAAARQGFGRVSTAKRTGWQAHSFNFKTTLSLTYATELEHGSITEVFTFKFEQGQPRLAGWRISSTERSLDRPAQAPPEFI
jgi:hypothetical protein